MLLYSLILFLHVAAAVALGAALGIEWTGVLRLRRANTLDTTRAAMGILFPLRYIGGVSMLLMLATGGYMSGVRWGMQPWIVMALVGIVAMGALGGAMSGRRYGAIGTALGQSQDALDSALRDKLSDPALLTSLHVRTGLVAAILMLMTVHPGWVASAVMLVGGGLLGFARAMWRPRSPVRATA
jgi:hypothetical protein